MRDRVIVQKQLAARGDHYRINDKGGEALTARRALGEHTCHRRHDFARVKQTSLDGRDRKAFKKRFNLRTHGCGGNAADLDDFSRRFRNDTGDGGQSINPVAALCERRFFSLAIDSSGHRPPLQDQAPSLPMASTGQPSIASLQRASSSGVSACL